MTDTAHRIVSTSILQDIADAIRAKKGTQATIAVEDFSTEIMSIPSGGGNPAGAIMPYGGASAPTGYLMCDGSAVSRTDYAALFTAIGTTYGSGDGSTTFNIPNLSGKVVIGVSNSHALGSSGGAEEHTLLTSELPAHVHEVPQHGHADDITITTPALSHSVTQPAYTYTKPNGTTKVTTGNSNSVYSGTTTGTATRSTSATVADHPATACTKSGGVTACSAFDTESEGGSLPHNNMQPYQVLNYIISTGI